MINRIILSCVSVFCLFALSLSLFGVEGPIQLSGSFRSFLSSCNRELEDFKIEIPSIPIIPSVEFVAVGGEWYEILLQVVLNFVMAWGKFINGIINFINVVITLLNVLIQLLQFTFIIIKNFITARDSLINHSVPLY